MKCKDSKIQHGVAKFYVRYSYPLSQSIFLVAVVVIGCETFYLEGVGSFQFIDDISVLVHRTFSLKFY
jgi:hypothetical protein